MFSMYEVYSNVQVRNGLLLLHLYDFTQSKTLKGA